MAYSPDDFQNSETFFREKVIGWMLGDLQRSIEVGTNYLSALGCLVYTEIIGNFMPSLDIREQGRPEEKSFYRCLFRFPSSAYLNAFDKSLRNETHKGIYTFFRHQMAHNYIPKIFKGDNKNRLFAPLITVAKVGYAYDVNGNSIQSTPLGIGTNGDLFLATTNYQNELKIVAETIYKRAFVDKDEVWTNAAIDGYKIIVMGR